MNLLNWFNGQPKTFDVSSVKYKKPVDEQIVSKLIDYIQLSYKECSKLGLHTMVVGVDGTINSLVIAILLKKALNDQVMAVAPDFATDARNTLLALCKEYSSSTFILELEKEYQDEEKAFQIRKTISHRNFYYRFTTFHLLTLAENMDAAVVDAIDKSDRLTGIRPAGFYGHLMPFYSLYKSEIYDLAKFLRIPDQDIFPAKIDDIPYPGNTTLSYNQTDPVLYLLTEKHLKPEEISQQYNIDVHWLRKMRNRINKQLFQTTVSQFII
ncbi:MAG: hypothetical protein HYZ79_01640 [Candidatus Melainabacteria bacterium]|nr:hypothetical protein [Candidatus Melainabacteria bacterium]